MPALQLSRSLPRRQVVHELHVVMHTHLRQPPHDGDAGLALRRCTVPCNCGRWIRTYWNVRTDEALGQIAADAEEHLLEDESLDA